ncbi:beta-propeller fold lactonase family protein [Streptomyces sp. NPDC014894]|uniref:beta-propeller fold lactonase family protein n=1 Tax=Streptomyces sp. NPDC014894 TaxID=3364931 RepID=UPI0037002FBF
MRFMSRWGLRPFHKRLLVMAPAAGLLAGAVALAPPVQAAGPQSVPAAAKPRAVAEPTVAYVTNRSDNQVAVVDAGATRVLARIPVGRNPIDLAVSPDHRLVYVANDGADRSVSVIDTATRSVVATVPVGRSPQFPVFSADGSRAFVSNYLDKTLSVIDTATHTVTATHAIDTAPTGAALSPDGTRLYLSQFGSITVFNTTTDTLEPSIPSPGGNRDITFTPDGTRAYVSNATDNRVNILNPATGAFTGSVPTGGNPFETVFTPDGTRAYTARNSGADVAVVDTATRTVTGSVSLPPRPSTLAISEDGQRLYATGNTSGTLSLIDTTTNTATARITTGRSPSDVVLVTPPTPASADLALALTAQPVPGLSGRVDYTLTATNNGPDPVASATLTAQLPVTGTTSPDCAVTGQTAECSLTAVAPGDSVTRSFRVPVALLSLGTPYTLTATRTAGTPADPTAGNDTASRTCTATTPLLINCA